MQNRDRLIDREQAESSVGKGLRGLDGAKRKKDSWTWTTVWGFQGERGTNGNGKNTITKKIF